MPVLVPHADDPSAADPPCTCPAEGHAPHCRASAAGPAVPPPADYRPPPYGRAGRGRMPPLCSPRSCLFILLLALLLDPLLGLLLPADFSQYHPEGQPPLRPLPVAQPPHGGAGGAGSFFRPIVPYGRQPDHQTIGWKNQVALRNIFSVPKHIPDQPQDNSLYGTSAAVPSNRIFPGLTASPGRELRKRSLSPRDLKPGDPAPPFSLVTIQGSVRFPQKPLNNAPILIHTFDKRSGFLEALWNTPHSFDGIIKGPADAQYIFLSTSASAYAEAQWMRKQLINRMLQLQLSEAEIGEQLQRMHFATTPVYELGNWIPDVLKEWRCEDHNCGYYQAVFLPDSAAVPLTHSTLDCLMYDENCAGRMNGRLQPVVLKRQDARYDWLPNMFVGFGSRATPILFAGAGCERNPMVRGKIAFLTDGGCSYFKKVWNMQQSGSLGVMVVAGSGEPIRDMNCQGGECSAVLSIPATMVPYDERIMALARQGTSILVRFQTTQSDNFYVGIDRRGRLQEMGWCLFPSFNFFAWHIEGMNYLTDLHDQLQGILPPPPVGPPVPGKPVPPPRGEPEGKAGDLLVNVFNHTRMHGEAGAFAADVQMPWDGHRVPFAKLTLDLELQCPLSTDRSCAEWDHTIHLFVCCDDTALCGMEMGRWITAYRRGVGRWLTDATHLMPLLTAQFCNFTMKHPPWTDAWYPVLTLRFSDPLDWIRANQPGGAAPKGGGPPVYPEHIEPMFVGSEPFDLTYESKFHDFHFFLPPDVRRVTAYCLITGHGSDNNNCAEFCVTTHNLLVNNANLNSRVFTNAGTPHGCAHRVRQGTVANQHGTWLYGRNGWCPGENVTPWIVDLTEQLRPGRENAIHYEGLYNNSKPNPTSNPGNIIISCYLSFWKDFHPHHTLPPPAQPQPYHKLILPGL